MIFHGVSCSAFYGMIWFKTAYCIPTMLVDPAKMENDCGSNPLVTVTILGYLK
jgi:hypothetical protein